MVLSALPTEAILLPLKLSREILIGIIFSVHSVFVGFIQAVSMQLFLRTAQILLLKQLKKLSGTAQSYLMTLTTVRHFGRVSAVRLRRKRSIRKSQSMLTLWLVTRRTLLLLLALRLRVTIKTLSRLIWTVTTRWLKPLQRLILILRLLLQPFVQLRLQQ